MKRTNNIEKYCACASALQKNTVKKRVLPTGGNDPTLSRRIRYSQLVRTAKTREVVVPLERPVIVQNVSPSF